MTTKRKLAAQPNIWKDKGIAPLKYCSLDRASRLLGCEVGDILHWGVAGYVHLCVELDGLESELRFSGLFDNEDVKNFYTQFSSKEYNRNIFFDESRVSRFNCQLRNDEYAMLNHSYQYAYYGKAYGLWALPKLSVREIALRGKVENKGNFFPDHHHEFYVRHGYQVYILDGYPSKNDMAHRSSPFYKEWIAINGGVLPETNYESITAEDLLISGKSLEKIHSALLSGEEMDEVFDWWDHYSKEKPIEKETIDLKGSLSVIGLMLDALKNAEPRNKRWIQSALKDEIKERHPEINPRWLDDYFSEANKSIKS